MNKLDELMRTIRSNLTTEEIKELVPKLTEEIDASEKINLKEVKANRFLDEYGF